MKNATYKVVGGDYRVPYLSVTPSRIYVGGRKVYSTAEVIGVKVIEQEKDPKYNFTYGALGALAFGPLGLISGALTNKGVITSTVAIHFNDGKMAIVECQDEV